MVIGVMYYFDAKKATRNLSFKPEKKHINLRGAQIFLNKTDAKGVPFSGKPFQIKEAGSQRLYNLAGMSLWVGYIMVGHLI